MSIFTECRLQLSRGSAILLLLSSGPWGRASAQEWKLTDGDYKVIEVCDEALWRSLFFLRGPSLPGALDNITEWGRDQFQDYAKKTVLPQAAFSLAFLIAALVALVVFLLWRAIRGCCVHCCGRERCAERQAAADPWELLGGCGYWLAKASTLLLAAAVFGGAVYCIATAQREVLHVLWGPLDGLAAHLDKMANGTEALLRGLDGAYPILTDLEALGADMNFTALQRDLQGVAALLDAPAANPATLEAALGSMAGAAAALRQQLADAKAAADAASPPVAALSLGLGPLGTAPTDCGGWSGRLAALQAEVEALAADTGPTYDTSGLRAALDAAPVAASWQPGVDRALGALTAWAALRDGSALGGLALRLAGLGAAVEGVKSNQVTALRSAASALLEVWAADGAFVADLLGRVDVIQATVARLDNATLVSLGELRSLFAAVNATVSRIQPAASTNPSANDTATTNFTASNMTNSTSSSTTPTTANANSTANAATANVTAAPGPLLPSLDALAARLALDPSLGALAVGLNSLQAALAALPPNTTAALTAVQSSLADLEPRLAATASALAAYEADAASQALFDALKNTIIGVNNTRELTAAAKDATAAAAADPSLAAAAAAASDAALSASVASVGSGVATASASIGAAAATLAATLPDLAPYSALAAAAREVYARLPTPQSQVVSPLQSSVASLEAQVLGVPAEVRGQVAAAQADLGKGATELRSKLGDKVSRLQSDYRDDAEAADLRRYQATCALFGLAALLGLMLFFFAAVNCPLGLCTLVTCALLLSSLFFLLAAGLAVGLVGAQDGCYHAEHVAVAALGSSSASASASSPSTSAAAAADPSAAPAAAGTTFVVNDDGSISTFPAPPSSSGSGGAAGGAAGGGGTARVLLEYYFFSTSVDASGAGSGGVRDVLRQAGVVDVDGVLADVTGQVDSIIAFITSRFIPRARLQAVLDAITAFVRSITEQVDALLALASASVVRPLYAALKAVPCCHVAGWVAETWVALTAGGWLLLGGAQAAMALLGRLDGLPGSSCCACRPLLLARLEGQVHPEERSTTSRPPSESPKKPYQSYTQPAAAAPPPQQAMVATGQPPPAYGGYQPYGGAYELQTTYAPVQPFVSGPTYAYGDPYGQPQYR